MPKPSIGRVVWVFPDGHDRGAQPLAGLIAYVHSDNLINVGVHDQEGRNMPMTQVRLIPAGEDIPERGHCACWMPYQIEQANKNQAETDKIMEAGKAALAEKAAPVTPEPAPANRAPAAEKLPADPLTGAEGAKAPGGF